MNAIGQLLIIAAASCATYAATESNSETLYLPLSGNGPSDAVEWDFQISAGRRTGERAKIPVPAQWEQHGFGDYDYGNVPLTERHKEDGLYQRIFNVPESWRGRRVRIVFDGSMTDTTVTVNGRQAGPVHQGAFYRFHHDITDKIRFGGENRLEVLVSKDSANPTVEDAERLADYWIFGGIFRPVWLEARPLQSVEWTSMDARADGAFRAKVFLEGEGAADRVIARVFDLGGKPLGLPMESPVRAGAPVEISGRVPGVTPWSAEEPQRYQVEFSLMHKTKVLHRVVEKTGFRTIEVRQGKGLFVNGTHVTIKGVNRHCFRAKTGRALDPQDSIDDVRLIKSMNMNAVRCSHYSPDKAFLDACDELGLYVVDELCTWQKQALDTPTARRLIGELIRRDVNHPSILWWANGNEGGWNTEVDGDYALWDIQQRPVIHPWELFSDFQTKHYPDWRRLQQDLKGSHLVMPTEYLHGLYDGGGGAGLEDYWNAITSRPNGIGGFLWVLADEGIMRTDRGGEVDNWGSNAPDGIVGPKHEKEASCWTVKDIFCPVQIAIRELPATFDGTLEIVNRYDFRDLASCKFRWNLRGLGVSQDNASIGGTIAGPPARPGTTATLTIPLPPNWRDRNVLELTALSREGESLWTWAWPTQSARTQAAKMVETQKAVAPETGGAAANGGMWRIGAGDAQLFFDARNGMLVKAMLGKDQLPIAQGPRLVGNGSSDTAPMAPVKIVRLTASGAESPNIAEFAIDGNHATHWSQRGRNVWLRLEFADTEEIDTVSVAWQNDLDRKVKWAFDLSEDGENWREMPLSKPLQEKGRWDSHGFPARKARFARLRGFGNDRNEWNSIVEIQVGKRVATPKPVSGTVRQSLGPNGEWRLEAAPGGNFKSFVWTVRKNGWIDLDYHYKMDGPMLYHGITFDLPESDLLKFSWCGQGPERVWANRMRGTHFGFFEREFRKIRPGIDYNYPQSPGYYAGIQQACLHTKGGDFEVLCHQDNTFLRIGTNDEGKPVEAAWPEGNFSILHAIPAIGNKFHKAELLGPQSVPHRGPVEVSGKVSFRFGK